MCKQKSILQKNIYIYAHRFMYVYNYTHIHLNRRLLCIFCKCFFVAIIIMTTL